jgi:hypothetical protein
MTGGVHQVDEHNGHDIGACVLPNVKPYKPPYAFTVTIGENCAKQFRTFADLAEKLKMTVEDLMRQCNGKVSRRPRR